MSVEWERFRVPAEWDDGPPPVLAPVPAQHMPALAEEDEVTIGLPGGPWLPDQLVASPGTSRQTWRGEVHECVQVASPQAWWVHRTWPEDPWRSQWWPLAHTWVYRDVQAPGADAPSGTSTPSVLRGPCAPGTPSVPAPQAAGVAAPWLDAATGSSRRPPLRRPVQARAAGPLTGRRVRVKLDGVGWTWRVAVTEPYDDAGDIVVKVAALSAWAVAPVRLAEFEPEHVSAVELHRLWVQ